MYGKCSCSKAEVCEQFRNKYSINDNNKVIDYVSIPRNGGCPNHNYADIHTFYHHCMAKMRLKTVAGMHMLDVNVPLPGDLLSSEYPEHRVFDICHICCYYLCKEYVKHTHKVLKFVVSQHINMIKDKDSNDIKDYNVRHKFQELHADNKYLWHVMICFPHNLERSMHKSLIMSSKLGITKRREKRNCPE